MDLNELVRSIDGMLRRVIGENVVLAASLSPDLGPVFADSGPRRAGADEHSS